MPAAGNGENARRAYWTQQMEEAHAFMRAIMDHPVRECGERAGSLPEAVEAAGVAVAFSAKPHATGGPRLFLLREGLIPAFIACARAMNERGWLLRVEDAFRTHAMQKALALGEGTFDAILRRVTWECGAPPALEFLRRRVDVLVAPCPKVGTHMSASAVDVSVLDRETGAEVDRGGPYLEMSERTPMDSPFVPAAAQANRREITALMRRHGFVAYPYEFWHYSRGDAFDEHLNGTGRPARYGPVSVAADGAVAPLPRPLEPLNSDADVRRAIERALSRA